METSYDIVIAGGGAAGILLANRITLQSPDTKIALLEKESQIGGRLRSTSPDKARWSYGLNRISDELYAFLDQTIKSQPDKEDIEEFTAGSTSSIGVLAANKVQSVPLSEMFTKKGARLIGGAAAARDWTAFDELAAVAEDSEKGRSNIGQVWSAKRKAPSAIVLEHLARSIGVPNVWQTAADAFFERKSLYEKPSFLGNWEELFDGLLPNDEESPSSVDILTDSAVAGAEFDSETKQWKIVTSIGVITTPKLAVCQSPWDAIRWLPKSQWPTELLAVVNKTKPVSVLTLSESLTGVSDIPETIIVPAEDCQIMTKPDCSEVTFQATLDYELSLQAPAVVKAVKRLKRARKKFLATYPDAKLEGDHLALQPVGWAQPISSGDKRYLKKLESGKYNQPHLMFCGDAYGSAYQGEKERY